MNVPIEALSAGLYVGNLCLYEKNPASGDGGIKKAPAIAPGITNLLQNGGFETGDLSGYTKEGGLANEIIAAELGGEHATNVARDGITMDHGEIDSLDIPPHQSAEYILPYKIPGYDNADYYLDLDFIRVNDTYWETAGAELGFAQFPLNVTYRENTKPRNEPCITVKKEGNICPYRLYAGGCRFRKLRAGIRSQISVKGKAHCV